jgi:hypothetical protein
MNIEPRGKWSLVCVAGYGAQPSCRGIGKVVEAGSSVDGCVQVGDVIIFLDIDCGVLKTLDCGYVLVHEDYIVATLGGCE